MSREKSPLRQKDIRTGAKAEQDRIILLFESRLCPTLDGHDWIDNEQCLCDSFTIEDIVAIIRGEEGNV